MVAIAVLATAFVSVRLHHEVAALRYRLWDLEEQRDRADRELRLAAAEYEETKSPRTLLEHWARVRPGAVASAAAAAPAAVPPVAPVVRPAASPTKKAVVVPERDPAADFSPDAPPEEGR